MKLSKEEVQHIAMLSRLELTEDEIEGYRDSLGSVLGYVAKLQELDTTGVAELAHGSGLTNVFRADEVIACNAKIQERTVNAFPSKQGTLLEVQAVFEERTE
jgi:aspartyl-tRNA(Asn)/glutamyl-tRNA(Gln) amidotransferase subunit C